MNNSDWSLRIANASQNELINISYELIIETLNEAKADIDNDKEYDIIKKNINKAQKILRNLMDSLDMSYPISLELMNLYLYINKTIIMSLVKIDSSHIDEAIGLLNNLAKGFEEANKKVANDKKPAMQNSQQVYAGLTYGKGTLNETVTNDKNRGFKA